MPDNKLYDILGVSRGASDQEIKKVYSFKIKIKEIFLFFKIGVS